MSDKTLKISLISLVGPAPTRNAAASLFYAYQSLASAYLRRKAAGGHLEVARLGVQIDDLALDCIAELFARDDQGTYTALRSYFHPVLTESSSEADVLGHSRRLVFSAVNHQLFRIFGSYDPTLRKLLRNLKSALGKDSQLSRFEFQGEAWVSFCVERLNVAQRLMMPPELLELHLVPLLRGNLDSRAMLDATCSIMNSQDEYARAYPILGLATVFRRSLLRLQQNEPPQSEDQIETEEIEAAIARSVRQVFATIGVRYVKDGKLTRSVEEAYLKATQVILEEEFVSGNGVDRSYYEVLRDGLPALDRDSYASEHRTQLEYLVRVSRQRFLAEMKKEL